MEAQESSWDTPAHHRSGKTIPDRHTGESEEQVPIPLHPKAAQLRAERPLRPTVSPPGRSESMWASTQLPSCAGCCPKDPPPSHLARNTGVQACESSGQGSRRASQGREPLTTPRTPPGSQPASCCGSLTCGFSQLTHGHTRCSVCRTLTHHAGSVRMSPRQLRANLCRWLVNTLGKLA